MEPIETKALKPTIPRRLQSSMAVHRAPLWLMKPTLPGRAMPAAKVALRPVSGLITPRQLGPMMRMLPRRASIRLAFQFQSGRADLLEAGRNDDGALDAFLGAFADDAGHAGGRRDDDGQVHLLGYVGDVLIGLDAEHAGPLGVDRENGAAEGAADQVPQNGAADAAGGLGGTDDGDGLGREEHIEWLGAFLNGFAGWFGE